MSDTAFVVKEQIATLQARILEAHPTLPLVLREIHKTLQADPEVVTLLTEEEIGIIVNGLSKQTQTTIATSLATKRTGKTIKSIGVADL
jgi:hypothetical protein